MYAQNNARSSVCLECKINPLKVGYRGRSNWIDVNYSFRRDTDAQKKKKNQFKPKITLLS